MRRRLPRGGSRSTESRPSTGTVYASFSRQDHSFGVLSGMFQVIRDLILALDRSTHAVSALKPNTDGAAKLEALEIRLSTLEGSVSVATAEAAATLLTAVAERKMARAAENRLHKLEAKRADFFGDDEESQVGVEILEGDVLPDGYAAPNGPAGADPMQAVYEGMDAPGRMTRGELALMRLKRANGEF